MKNKIIKTVCFSLLALSVALCAVFTLPKKDNLKVNAQVDINPNLPNFQLDIPFSYSTISYVEDTVQKWSYFPYSVSFVGLDALDIFMYNADMSGGHIFAYHLISDNSSDSVFCSFEADFSPIVYYTFTASNFYFDLSNVSDSTPIVRYRFSSLGEDTYPLSHIYVTLNYIVPTPGEAATILTSQYELNQTDSFPLYEIFNHLVDTPSDIIYITRFYLSVTANDISAPVPESAGVEFYDLPFSSFSTQRVYAELFYNYWDSSREVVEYQVNFLQSLAQSVDSFMKTEFLPNVSFYDLLLFCIVIPLVVVVLKMWLGG